MTAQSSTSELPANTLLRLWAQVKSWFEIPFGYEDETGFHYGHEPMPVKASTPRAPFREVFTDRACDSAAFMAATSSEAAPAPAPEQPIKKRELAENAS